MFDGMNIEQRREFLAKTYNNFIPGYTGHCPNLKFQYGEGYGANTRDILKDLRTKDIFHGVQEERYPSQDKVPAVEPVPTTSDYTVDYKNWSPKHITGYTGFIPTVNRRYGKSYSRAVEDCSFEYDTDKLKKIQVVQEEAENLSKAQSTPGMNSIRSRAEVKRALNDYIESGLFQDHELPPDYPSSADHIGHFSGKKGSLCARYNNVLKRGQALLQNERATMTELVSVLEEFEELHETIKT